ncbi:hypothetical protein [Lysobacter sp. A03]|uniref:hypothetical protein n=1 Tax=Lysobacter sp. A03 TaxID=1199154 RepID=UPI0005B7180C|nr:hypothetical protein [Lysobacter sp. A03]KIQ96264.1 Replicative DNA helicase [Lysobacter sp. A03]
MKHERVVSPDLLREIRRQFRLDWAGHHGFPHWARVYRHGLYVGRAVGADLRVVELFAFLHDSQRENEYTDPEHGSRAAHYACWLRSKGRFELDAPALDLLVAACQGHSDGHQLADPTVMACWDADRLDLGRVGIRPDPRRLCTVPARDPGYLARAWRGGVAHRDRIHRMER